MDKERLNRIRNKYSFTKVSYKNGQKNLRDKNSESFAKHYRWLENDPLDQSQLRTAKKSQKNYSNIKEKQNQSYRSYSLKKQSTIDFDNERSQFMKNYQIETPKSNRNHYMVRRETSHLYEPLRQLQKTENKYKTLADDDFWRQRKNKFEEFNIKQYEMKTINNDYDYKPRRNRQYYHRQQPKVRQMPYQRGEWSIQNIDRMQQKIHSLLSHR